MRCFVACFVAPRSATKIREACPPLANVRWVPTQNYHVTLHFLGDVASRQVDGLLRIVATLSGQAPTGVIESITGYPRAWRARAVVAQLSPDAALSAWNALLREQCPRAAEEERTFAPHVTLARAKEAVRVVDDGALSGMQLELTAPALYRSVTRSEGAVYEQLEAC